ncbi:MAG: type II secretion system protein [Gemmatimonadetes bacterium]|nr:type II secretion system protein [Gemmatimonadota bacterium]MDA1103768.1 type II secretion system protein [Gemmatimonadota bacterium]
MKRKKSGFTLIELVIVIVIGSILTGVALSSFQNVQTRFAVRSAKSMYMTLHQRARSKAVEYGETVLLLVYTNGDSVLIFSPSQGISDITRFDEQLNVDLRTQGNASFMMCMTPRGYSDYNCGSYGALGFTQTFADTVRLQFWLNADSASVLVLPMGQLVGE